VADLPLGCRDTVVSVKLDFFHPYAVHQTFLRPFAPKTAREGGIPRAHPWKAC
jgi:hypothetical protein